MTKTKKELREKLPNRVAYWINEFIEKRCDRIYLRKRIMEEFEALQAKDEEIVGKIEKFRSELEGIEEMVSLDSILYKFDDFLSSLKKGDKTK